MILLVVMAVIWRKVENSQTILEPDTVMEHEIKDSSQEQTEESKALTDTEESVVAQNVRINKLSAQRVDTSNIKLQWTDNLDAYVTEYVIEKYDNCAEKGTWKVVGVVGTQNHTKGQLYEYTDELGSTDPQQYVYHVVPQFQDADSYVLEKDPQVLCSNWMICIDPGHYAGKNAVPGTDSYGYAEGDFTLQVALELQQILENDYGIAVSMTRDTGSISIDGYTDDSLDSGHISLRGTFAAEQGCNLFVSIHTNANEDNANGAGTFQQPISIDKPILIANDRMLSSDLLRRMCNQVGQNLAETSYDLGISSHKEFAEISGSKVREWTTSYNDSTQELGTVVCRHGNHGQYYGVLRGAEEAGIPGVIIEHGYHTVMEMRDVAKNGSLSSEWAQADAQGIASAMRFNRIRE